jgi:hypothetical protein
VFEVVGLELLPVQQGEGEAIGKERAQLLHQVEGQRWLAGPDSVQVADARVETDLFEGAMYGDAKHSIQEGQQAVDRVFGWAP